MNNKLRAIIIDDERKGLEAIKYELETFTNDIEIVACCNSGFEGIKAIEENAVDIVFLDIEMPKMNGFEMLEKLNTIDFDVVFTTAYDEFALKAFRISAMDYLLKPIRNEDLKNVIDKAKKKVNQPQLQQQLEMLFKYIKHVNPEFPSIAIPTLEGLEFVVINEIVNCQAESNYCNIFLADGSKFLASKTLKEIEIMLEGHSFVRVHNSHIINIAHMKRYINGKGGEIVLKNGRIIPVSRSRKVDLMKLF